MSLRCLRISGIARCTAPPFTVLLPVVCLALIVTLAAAVATADSLTIRQPDRDFGYTLGDVLTQDVLLPDLQSEPDLTVLSAEARVSNWLERQSASMVQTRDGRLLRLRYQIINAPDTIQTSELPALSLKLSDGTTLKWQAWPFSLGPLTAAEAMDSLKADDRLAPYDVRGQRSRLMTSAIAVGTLLIAYGLWWLWRSLSDRQRLPFAYAAFRLRKVNNKDPESLDRWKIVHEAFNVDSGRVVTASDVPGMLKRHEWMADRKSEVEAFFDASAARFFSRSTGVQAFDLQSFAQRMADEERRHAV